MRGHLTTACPAKAINPTRSPSRRLSNEETSALARPNREGGTSSASIDRETSIKTYKSAPRGMTCSYSVPKRGPASAMSPVMIAISRSISFIQKRSRDSFGRIRDHMTGAAKAARAARRRRFESSARINQAAQSGSMR